MRFDLWTGEEDKILRRIEVEFGFDLPKDLQQDTQGVERGTVEMALEIADVNEDQDDHGAQRRAPAVRAAERARAWRRSAASVARGGLRRGGGSSGSGSSGGRSRGGSSGGGVGGRAPTSARAAASSGLDSERSQRYLDCLGEAKKPADIEKCAAILEE